jgi:hypothetical protein
MVQSNSKLATSLKSVAYPGEVLGGSSTPLFQLIVYAKIKQDNVLNFNI